MGYGPASVHALPDWMSKGSARVGDQIPALPWCSETMALLENDNVTDPQTLASLLGRAPWLRMPCWPPCPRKAAAMPELQNSSRTNPQQQAARFMHASLVVVWLGTAVVSALDYLGLSGLNHEGARLLDQGGIGDARWQALLIWSGLLADLALGLALLLRPAAPST
jgi:hypothetical protein